MQVTLRVEGHLREFFPRYSGPVTIALAAPATVAEILTQAGIPPELPGAVLCNGLRVNLEHRPADGDELVLLSPLAGG
jgi:sulfur carrier protein ThiS